MDEDIINDVDVTDEDASRVITLLVNWFVRQINVILCHKRMDILEKKLGAISGCLTRVVFVRMMR